MNRALPVSPAHRAGESSWGIPLLATSVLFLISLYSYPAFHSVAELSIGIGAVAVTILGNAKGRVSRSNSTLYLSFGYLIVGAVGIAHALASSLAIHDLIATWGKWGTVMDSVAMIVLLLAALFLRYRTQDADRSHPRKLNAAILLGLAALSLLIAFESESALLGHALKLASCWFLFAVFIQTNLEKPLAAGDRLAQVYDAIPDPVILVDRKGTILEANHAARTLARELQALPLQGAHCRVLFQSRKIPADECPVCRLIGEGAFACSVEVEVEVDAREVRCYSIALSPLHQETPSAGLVLVMRDTTREKRGAALLRENQALLEEGERLARLGSWEWNAETDEIRISKQLRALSGLPDTVHISRARFLSWVDAEDRHAVQQSMAAMRQGADTPKLSYRVRLPENAVRHLESVARVEHGVDGKVVRIVGTAQDVTERMRVDAEFHRIMEQLEAVFAVINCHVAYLDTDFNFIRVNPTYAHSTGRQVGFFPGKNHFALFPHAENEAIFRKVVEIGIPYSVTAKPFVNPLDAGSHVTYWDWSLHPIKDQRGKVVALVLSLLDMTEREMIERQRIRHEEELNAAKVAAERASASKTRFLATASHDLRQPIQAIHILLYLLRESELDAGAQPIVSRIESAVNGLVGMLDTLLDISKLDAGLVVPEASRFPVSSLLLQLAKEFELVAASKGLNLAVIESSVKIASDPNLLARILRNFISNAIRYTKSGTVLVGCRRRGGHLRIDVVDTGIGIPREELHDIFLEFHQLGNQARDRREGIGLGLAIVERLAKLLGHSIDVSSEVGKGSRFSVTVACANSSEARSASRKQQAFPADCLGRRVLVIDDDVDIRDGLTMLLERWGCEAFSAESLEAALGIVASGGVVPDLIIADYRLGDANGIEAMHRLRRELGIDVPGILLTGDTDPNRLVEADSCGVLLMNKPVRSEELREHVGAQIVAGLGRKK